MKYVAMRPDKRTPLGIYEDMRSAQEAVALAEPDLLLQCEYQIHPVKDQSDLTRLKLKVIEVWTLEKFDGEYVGQAPVEVIHLPPEIS